MIIDCHCHAGKGEKFTNHWNTEALLTKYLRRARAAGINRTILLSTQHRDYAVGNARHLRIAYSMP